MYSIIKRCRIWLLFSMFAVLCSCSSNSQVVDPDGGLYISWSVPTYGDPVASYVWSYNVNGVADSITGVNSASNRSESSLQLANVGDWAIFSIQAVSINGDSSAIAYSDTVHYSLSLGVDDEESLPESFDVAFYPNPSTGSSELSYALSVNKVDNYSITIYDVLGRKVSTLLNRRLSIGDYETNITKNFASGVYFAVVKSSDTYRTVKLSIIR